MGSCVSQLSNSVGARRVRVLSILIARACARKGNRVEIGYEESLGGRSAWRDWPSLG
jgi:hypothetical protein